MVFSLFNLVVGLIATGVFAGAVLLINRWQKNEPFVVKVFGWSGLATVTAGLIFSFAGAIVPVTLNVVALFVLLLGSVGLAVFAILATQQVSHRNSYAREFGYLVSGIILTLGVGLALIIGGAVFGPPLVGVLLPLILGWFIALCIWLHISFG